MTTAYLKTTLRSLTKNKSYTFLNLLGLSSGLMVFMLITLYMSHEWSYDKYHEKADRLYRVYKEDIGNSYQGTSLFAIVPTPLAPTMKSEFPEVQEFTRVNDYHNTLIKAGDEIFLEASVHSADPKIFEMFTLPIIHGNQKDILRGPDAAVISESAAMKYFGKTDVVGEVIHFRNEYPFKITGVIQDMPKTSHFVMDVILNFEGLLNKFDARLINNWNSSSHYAFVLLQPDADYQALEDKLPVIREKYAGEPVNEGGQKSVYYLQPLAEMHFTKGVNFDLAPSVNANDLYIYLGIAIMILVIAAINYVNLATAQAMNKMREVGIRKVIGAQRRQLMAQLLTESGTVVLISLLLSLGLLLLVMPLFSQFIGKEIVVDLSSGRFWFGLLGLGLVMTLLSGIYPAVMIASFRPIAALKGKSNGAVGKGMLRNALVVFQFTISCALILGATVLTRQLNYIQTTDTGFVRDQIVVLGMRDRGVRDKLDIFKEELKSIPGVVSVSSSNFLPNSINSNTYADWVGKKEGEQVMLYTNTADHSFLDLYEMELVQGRNFDPDIPEDKSAVLLNESAVKALGWENPIGMQMIRWGGDTGKVVGVLKDFHQHSLRVKIEPLQIFHQSGQFNVSVKIEGARLDEVVEALEAKYLEFDPVYPFEYNYFSDVFDRAYMSEIKATSLARWFTGFAVLIACLGLYGLASYKVQHRIKEVGVRKVLGASVSNILTLLSKDFALLLLIAFLVAAPIAYFVMQGWLEGFAYHVNINPATFLLALVLMLFVAGLTVGYRTFSAAVRNPVEALRDE